MFFDVKKGGGDITIPMCVLIYIYEHPHCPNDAQRTQRVSQKGKSNKANFSFGSEF
jgi:hypothetical protein